MTAITEVLATRLFTVEEAAVELGVGKNYVYSAIKAGELPVVELGTGTRSKIRVRATALELFIEQRTHTADPAADVSAWV
ncbi:helix-turn-helix domain-containing protein [Arthrobacter sp. NPDC090010]|uniref:helix-turn-helix domain-containing protein n=1 Tax=Arthrobacter sp. NPDC090010 TaxID=3363942 RepID=UPI003817ECD5